MSNKTDAVVDFIEKVSADARALVAATSDATGDRVAVARKQLDSALESGRELADHLQKKAVAGAKYTDQAVRENPYAPILIALVVGGLIALLFSRNRD